MRRTLLVLVSLIAVIGADAFAQVQGGVVFGTIGGVAQPGVLPAGPNQPVPTGTASISGRVTAAPAGTPLRHAQVMLNATDSAVRRTTTTDAEGRYRFADLPGGRYVLMANKAGFVTLQYGQRRPSEPGMPLSLNDGQALNAANFALPRGGVIAGRVTDEYGEPIARAMVQALRYFYGPDGQRRPQPNASATTDDLGQFRLFGLSPGEYVVSASGQGIVSISGAASTVDTSDSYLTSYFPGTPNILDAQVVSLTAGQETSVQFALATGRLSRVAGVVVDSTGKPLPNAMAILQAREGDMPFGMGGGMTGPDGAFVLNNVAPGDYLLNVQPIHRPGAGAPAAEFASVGITVGAGDISNLRVATSPGATVTGRVVFEGSGRRDNGQGGKIRVITQSTTSVATIGLPVETGQVADDGSFELAGVRGPLLFRVAGGPSWTLKSVSVDGTEITDTPTDLIGPDALTGVTIVLTDKLTDVSGQVTDGRGRPIKDYLVVLQPAEPKPDVAMSRYLRTIRPEQDGRFSTRGLPPGEYLATAVQALEPGRQFVPDVRARLRDTARRFAVREGETVMLDLKLTPDFE